MPSITYQVIQKPLEERLIDAACVYWDVERDYFYRKDKGTVHVYRKKVLYYIIRETCPYLTLESIASMFGYTSHQPVFKAIDAIDAQKDVYKQTLDDIRQISNLADKLIFDLVTTQVQLVKSKNNDSIHAAAV